MANAEARREKARTVTAKSRGLAVACEGGNTILLDEHAHPAPPPGGGGGPHNPRECHEGHVQDMWDRQGEQPLLLDGPGLMLSAMRYHLESQGHQVRGDSTQNDTGEIHHQTSWYHPKYVVGLLSSKMENNKRWGY